MGQIKIDQHNIGSTPLPPHTNRKLLAQIEEYRHELGESRTKAEAVTREKEMLEYQLNEQQHTGNGWTDPFVFGLVSTSFPPQCSNSADTKNQRVHCPGSRHSDSHQHAYS